MSKQITLNTFITQLKELESNKDHALFVCDIINKIDIIEPKNSFYIDTILDTIEDNNTYPMARGFLASVLKDLVLSDTQIERVWQILENQNGSKDVLLESLKGAVKNNHKSIIKKLYNKFEITSSVTQKISFAKILLESSSIEEEVTTWFFSIIKDNSLPDIIDDSSTLALQLECCEILSSKEKNLRKVKNLLFNRLVECAFLKCGDEQHWESLTDTLIKIPVDNNDINKILSLSKNKNLISYHRIHFLWILTKVEANTYIVNSLIDLLFIGNEPFEDFNKAIFEVLSNFTITQNHIEYIKKLSKELKVYKSINGYIKRLEAIISVQ